MARRTQLLGLSYYRGGHPADAIPLLEKVQGWYPRANVDASYVLGICYIQTKDYPQARKAFGKMFDVPPDSAASYLFTAQMLLRQEFDPVAEEYAQKAAALDPKLPLAHYLLGELYIYKSRIPEAIVEFQKELAINPAHAATYYKLADAYSRIQKYEDAQHSLQRSIWLDQTATGPFILMGKVLEKKGELDLAVIALKRAATMDPNNPMTHHLLGQAYREMGKKEEAEGELKLAEAAAEPNKIPSSIELERRGLVAAAGLDFDIDVHQRHGGRRYAWNARRLANGAWADVGEFFLHLAREAADGTVIEPFGDRVLLGLLQALHSALLLQQVAFVLDLGFDGLEFISYLRRKFDHPSTALREGSGH